MKFKQIQKKIKSNQRNADRVVTMTSVFIIVNKQNVNVNLNYTIFLTL